MKAQLQEESLREKLDNVIFAGRQEKNLIPGFLSITNVSLVHLKKAELFEFVLPSKIFESAAMAKPIILGVEGFAARLVTQASAGVCIEPENGEQLADAVEKLADNAPLCESLGLAGREFVVESYDRDSLASEYMDILAGLSR